MPQLTGKESKSTASSKIKNKSIAPSAQTSATHRTVSSKKKAVSKGKLVETSKTKKEDVIIENEGESGSNRSTALSNGGESGIQAEAEETQFEDEFETDSPSLTRESEESGERIFSEGTTGDADENETEQVTTPPEQISATFLTSPVSNEEYSGEFGSNTISGSITEDEASLPKFLPLEKCQYCHRSFWPNRLEMHESVCLAKLKQPGDDSKVDLGVKKIVRAKNQKEPPYQLEFPFKTWQTEHQDFMYLIESKREETEAKQWVEGHKRSYAIPPPPHPEFTNFKDYIQCQTCGRRFFEDVADKHLLNCTK